MRLARKPHSPSKAVPPGRGDHRGVFGWRSDARRGRNAGGLKSPQSSLLANVLVVLALLLLTPALRAGPAEDCRAHLPGLLNGLPSAARVGVAVLDAASGQPIFLHDADAPLKPASVMKLLVTAAALEHFDGNFGFETRILLSGDELWVIGAGDPALGDERLAQRHNRPRFFPFNAWIEALKARGVQRVSKIVLDDSIFEAPGRHPDWPDDQNSAWYQAPVGGLNFNDNCLDALVRRSGNDLTLQLEPPLPDNFVENALHIGSKPPPLLMRSFGRDTFEFRGAVARDTRFAPVSVREPTIFFGFALRQALQDAGIAVTGPVVRRAIPPPEQLAAAVVATHRTPLADVLWRCNRFSQNLFAECLLKALPAYTPAGRPTGTAGAWPAGAAAVERVMRQRMRIDMTGAVLRDGSGLSHENRLTARQVAGLLVRMHGHPAAAVFRESLAVPGETGSMRRRYADPVLNGTLRGKTGTLSGVRTLAGYIRRPDGQELTFALFCEGPCPAKLPVQVARVLSGASPQ